MSDVPAELERTPVPNAIQEKVNEYQVLIAPVEQAIRELQFAQGMLRARAEEEIHALSPALEALAEALDISTLDLLLAKDRAAFLQEAVAQAQVPVEEVRRRLLDAGVGEHLRSLGLPEAA
jgi:predicted transcriptional regulator